jgi:transposase-like protein
MADTAEEREVTAAESPSNREVASLPEWAEQAFRLWCRGQRNLSALARQFGCHRDTVKANIDKFRRLVQLARNTSSVDAWEDAITAQEEILAESWRTYSDPGTNAFAKSSLLKVAAAAVEEIAILNGVVTRRGELTIKGPGANGEHTVNHNLPSNGELSKFLFNAGHLAERLPGGKRGVGVGGIDRPADMGVPALAD